MNSERTLENRLFNNIALTRNWIRKEYQPVPPVVKNTTAVEKSEFIIPQGLFILMITEGHGTIEINSMPCKAAPGKCFVLYYYHIFRIIPDRNSFIKYSLCTATDATYLLCSSLPGDSITVLERAECIIEIDLSNEEYITVNDLLSRMIHKSEESYTLLFECLIRLSRAFERQQALPDKGEPK